jgi:TolB-like protein
MISVVGLGAVWRYTHAPEAPVPSVVVLPFDNVGDASDAYLAAGLTDEIAGTLARIPGVQVLGRASTSVERTDRLTPREVARSLGARWVLTGSVRWSRASGGATPRVRIAPALVEVETGAQTCCDPVEDAPDDVFKVQAEVATRVAQGLSLQLTAGDRAALAATDTRDAEARDAQRSGRYLLRLRGLPNVVAAEREFARAVGRDSQYARAWAGLAEAALLRYSSYDLTRSRQSLHEDARRASERAVALAPTDPVVLVARARVLSDADLRLVPALALVDSALGTDPSDVSAWLLRTELLLGLGRVEEAAQAVTRARVLDNLAGLVWMETMYVHFAKAQFDSAVTAAERAVTLGAGNLIYARSLVLALALAGRTDEASAMCKSAMESEAACRAFVGALGSRTPERFLAAAGAAEQRARSFGDRRAEPTASAIAYARLGRLDTALERLEFAAATRDPSLILLLQHPAFTPLRSTPRYRALMDTLQRP